MHVKCATKEPSSLVWVAARLQHEFGHPTPMWGSTSWHVLQVSLTGQYGPTAEAHIYACGKSFANERDVLPLADAALQQAMPWYQETFETEGFESVT